MADQSLFRNRARTKIIATVGPACRKAEQLDALVKAGADVFRLNMAHGDVALQTEVLNTIRQLSSELDWPLGVLVDLAGPKIRLGEIPGDEMECLADDIIEFVRGEVVFGPKQLTATYERLIDELGIGDTVVLADGAVSLQVASKDSSSARCRVIQPGFVRSRQGLNLPGVKLSTPSMDEEDREHAVWAADHGVDFIGLSFVRHADDVVELKELVKSRGSAARVIAKIEKPEALDCLNEIVAVADGVMVARGDLGVEIDIARTPLVQKQIIAACQRYQKPVIIATQMLESMQHSQRPTRAEVTDIANAILDGADACMLSGETVVGQYPREAVAMMNRVALITEELYRERPPVAFGENASGLHQITRAVVCGAAEVATKLKAALIVVASHNGATALALSKQRNYAPIVGISDRREILQQMSLMWGIVPLPGAPTGNSNELLDFVVRWGLSGGAVQKGDHLVLVAGVGLGTVAHNMVRVHHVE